MADVFKIFFFDTGNDSAVSVISENVKINSSLLRSHSTPKTFLASPLELIIFIPVFLKSPREKFHPGEHL